MQWSCIGKAAQMAFQTEAQGTPKRATVLPRAGEALPKLFRGSSAGCLGTLTRFPKSSAEDGSPPKCIWFKRFPDVFPNIFHGFLCVSMTSYVFFMVFSHDSPMALLMVPIIFLCFSYWFLIFVLLLSWPVPVVPMTFLCPAYGSPLRLHYFQSY